MTAAWPTYRSEWVFPEDAAGVELIKEAVTGIRNVRTSLQVPPSKKANVYVVSEEETVLDIFRRSESFFDILARADHSYLQKTKEGIGDDAISAVIPHATIYIPFAELVDVQKERERLKKEEERLTKEIARSNGMLGNEKFMSRAPKAKVEEEQAKLEKYKSMMAQVQERLAQLG